MRPSMKTTMFVLAGLLPVAARAAQLPDKFTLGRYVPADVWLYIHGAENPERAWIDAQWGKVLDALKKSGIDRDVISLALSSLDEAKRTEVQATIDKWTGLAKAIQWGDLVSKETLFAERVGTTPAMYEYFVLTRGKEGSADGNMAALVALLKEVATLSDKITLESAEHDGVTAWSLGFAGAEQAGVPFSLELFRHGDVIGLTSNKSSAAEVFGLMAGKSEKPSMARSERFLKAVSEVPPPSDVVTFFDAKLFFTGIGKMLGAAGQQVGDDPEGAKWLGFARTILDQVDVTDYVVTTVETRGRREIRHELTRFQSEKHKSEVCSAFLDRKAFDRFDRYVPADATGFSVSASADIERLYKFAVEFVKKNVPDGEAHIAKWNELLASIGFDPEKDLFSWLSGETIEVSLPAAVVSPMGGGGDFVWMIRVKDAEIAQAKVDQFIEFVSKLAQGQGQALMVTPVSVNGGSFKQITHPMAAMFLRPVVGVTGEWLVVAANPAAVTKCLDVAAGKSPSITENARFKAEGLTPKGAVRSASFADTSKFGQELGGLVGIIGMAGGMATAGIPDDNGGKEMKAGIQKVLGIVMKLGPVLQKIDFYSSEASVSTYDGESAIRTDKVVTYKDSKAETEKSPDGK